MVSQISLKISPENSFKYSSRISLDDSVVDFIDDCSKTSSVDSTKIYDRNSSVAFFMIPAEIPLIVSF